jgi:plasmid stabilization system protein ParE
MSLTYKVVISDEALSDLRRYVGYLIYVKKNPQAASNILDDYDETIAALAAAAGSMKPCESPNMRSRRLRRINFRRHNYFLLYQLEGQTAYVTNVFHGMEDADNKLR